MLLEVKTKANTKRSLYVTLDSAQKFFTIDNGKQDSAIKISRSVLQVFRNMGLVAMITANTFTYE